MTRNKFSHVRNAVSCLFFAFGLMFLLPACAKGDPHAATGIRFGLALEGLPDSPSEFQAFEQETGLPVTLINFFLQWPQSPEHDYFPESTLSAVHEFGAVPVLTWEPMYYADTVEHMIPVEDILGGVYDPYIRLFAVRIRSIEQPVIVRFAHEMNLSRYHWGGSMDEYGPESPGKYRDLFRHVVRIFRESGANNVLFAFCPNWESVPNPIYDSEAEWNKAANYYPGDEYVDVLGMDGYNWGTNMTLGEHGWDSRWQTFGEIFGDIFKELRSLSTDKPLYVFETASVSQGGDKNKWVQDAFGAAQKWGVEGIIWFHVDKEEDWRLILFKESEYHPQVKDMTVRP